MEDKKPLLGILGPTASGKTALAVALAQKIDGEILSADSRQVYLGMDIGTGKDLNEYLDTPYHLIDIVSAGEQYDLSQFQQDFKLALEKIQLKNKPAILCGGSGMYIQAVLQNFQQSAIPKNQSIRTRLASVEREALMKELNEISTFIPTKTTPTSKKQLIRAIEIAEFNMRNQPVSKETPVQSIPHLLFGLAPERSIRRERISQRLKNRIEQGLIQEVEGLLNSGIPPEQLIYYGLEYKWATIYLQNQLSFDDFFTKLEVAIHQFAKRQMTYFKKMEKDGLKIEWLNNQFSTEEKLDFIEQKIRGFKPHIS